MIARKYKNLTDEQVEAVAEHARTFLQSKIHTPVQPGYGMKYTDKNIQTAFNFLDDTFLKYMPPEINEYAFERALNSLRRELTGKKYTVGHSRKDPADWWWFGGDEVAAINPQIGGLNLTQFKLDSAFQSAMRKGDYDVAQKIMDEMVRKGMRSSMVDDYGELIFFGAPAKKGKLAEGGLISNPLTAMMNSGGFMDYGEMKQVVPPLDPGEKQHLVKGGKKGPIPTPGTAVQYVKNQIMPSVLKNVSQMASKMLPKDTTNPFVVVDKNNLPIKDFKTQNEAETWLNTKGETVSEDEFYESIINYSVKSKDQIQSETVSTIQETPAMVYKTPEVIKNAAMEVAPGKQWLGILKKAGVSPKELDDTSIGPYLSIQAPNKKITKSELMETFDQVSPNFEVIAMGKRDVGKMSKNIIDKFNQVKSNVQMSGTDQGVVNNFGAILQNTMTATTDKQLSSVSKQLNSLLKRAYGIDNALASNELATNTQIAAPIRSILGDLSELLKTRGASLTYEANPQYSVAM